jgi:hypothetical protein
VRHTLRHVQIKKKSVCSRPHNRSEDFYNVRNWFLVIYLWIYNLCRVFVVYLLEGAFHLGACDVTRDAESDSPPDNNVAVRLKKFSLQ